MEKNKELEQVIESKFLTPSKFALEIEKIVAEEKFNYIDAICHYCEINNLEVESVTKLVSKPLKEKLKWDATRLNFMKRHDLWRRRTDRGDQRLPSRSLRIGSVGCR